MCEWPQHRAARPAVGKAVQVLAMNLRRELALVTVGVRSQHPQREVGPPVEEAAQATARYTTFTLHVAIAGEAPHPCIHQHEPSDSFGMPQAQREADGAAVIVDDERQWFRVESLDELREVVGVSIGGIGEISGPIGQTESDMVGGDASVCGRKRSGSGAATRKTRLEFRGRTGSARRRPRPRSAFGRRGGPSTCSKMDRLIDRWRARRVSSLKCGAPVVKGPEMRVTYAWTH